MNVVSFTNLFLLMFSIKIKFHGNISLNINDVAIAYQDKIEGKILF